MARLQPISYEAVAALQRDGASTGRSTALLGRSRPPYLCRRLPPSSRTAGEMCPMPCVEPEPPNGHTCRGKCGGDLHGLCGEEEDPDGDNPMHRICHACAAAEFSAKDAVKTPEWQDSESSTDDIDRRCYGIALNGLKMPVFIRGYRCWDRLRNTWEVYIRRNIRGLRASCIVRKGIRLPSSISTQPTQASINEDVLNRQT